MNIARSLVPCPKTNWSPTCLHTTVDLVFMPRWVEQRESILSISLHKHLKTQRRYLPNGINPDKHVFEATDAFQWKSPESMDIFICDPPSLSKGKHSDSNAQKAYQDLHQLCKTGCKGQSIRNSLFAQQDSPVKSGNVLLSMGFAHGQWSWLWRSYEPFDHPTMLEHFEARHLKFALLHRRQ